MSTKKPIRGENLFFRQKGSDKGWIPLRDAELNIHIPGYDWSPCIMEKTGVRILHFIMN